MTFYQELQLNQAGSKLMIQEAVGRRAKAWHLLVYLVKILLTMVFCVAFVTLYGWVFGAENNIVGVVVLLCLMVFRQADLGMRRGQSLLALGLVFLVLAFGPRLANLAELGGELAVHGLSLLVILVLGCHNVGMGNHLTLVLGYLLLYGYDVEAAAFPSRLAALAVGCGLTLLVYAVLCRVLLPGAVGDWVQIQTFLFRLLGALPLWMGALSLTVAAMFNLAHTIPMMVVVLGCLGGLSSVLRMVMRTGVDWLARGAEMLYHLLLTAPMDVLEVPLWSPAWLGWTWGVGLLWTLGAAAAGLALFARRDIR